MAEQSRGQRLNTKNPAIKRILREVVELTKDTSTEYTARPLEDNVFEWHFTIKGPVDTEYQNGRYHGRILLPPEYPFKPPAIVLLTPNGRFETNKKICLSITGYHPEFWQPAWGVRTALLALISFLPTKAEGAIGGLDWTPEERKKLAVQSLKWSCPTCGAKMAEILQNSEVESGSSQDAKDAVDLSMFQLAYEKDRSDQQPAQSSPETSSASRGEPAHSEGTQSTTNLRQRTTETRPQSIPREAISAAPSESSRAPPQDGTRLLYDLLFYIVVFLLCALLLRKVLVWLHLDYYLL